MLTLNEIKHIQSLQQKKFRNLNNCFIAEGPKIVEAFFNSQYIFEKIYAKKEWILNQLNILEKHSIPYVEITDKELQRISGLTTPNYVLATIRFLENNCPEDMEAKGLILALDEIQDPGNFGTIIRTADWFGIHYILCSENCADAYNPKVVQASMGSLTRVNIFYTDLLTFIKKNKDKTTIFGTFTKGKNISEFKQIKNGLVIIGNESRGVSEELASLVHHKISIPPLDINGPESLNAAVATGIICYALKKT